MPSVPSVWECWIPSLMNNWFKRILFFYSVQSFKYFLDYFQKNHRTSISGIFDQFFEYLGRYGRYFGPNIGLELVNILRQKCWVIQCPHTDGTNGAPCSLLAHSRRTAGRSCWRTAFWRWKIVSADQDVFGKLLATEADNFNRFQYIVRYNVVKLNILLITCIFARYF